jgi:sialate O-acetylesterase
MLKLNPLITNGVILQANQPVLISGITQANSCVSLILNNENHQTQADDKGNFVFKLPAYNCGLIGDLKISTENDETTIKNVKFGEVFLLAGQSNIEFKMHQEAHFEEVLKENLEQYDLTYINVPQVEYLDENGKTQPQELKWQDWAKLNKETLGEMSAVGFYMAVEYAKNNPNVPVGLVACNKGGTSVTAWIDEESLKASPLAQKYVVEPYNQALVGKSQADFDKIALAYKEKAETYYALRAKWVKDHPELTLGQIKEEIGGSPWPPPPTPQIFTRPSGLYHTMFEKILPYSFSSVVWYQGEEDSLYPDMYTDTLPVLQKTWRRDLQSPELPFYIIQLPLFDELKPKSWPGIRQAQLKTALLDKNSHIIVTADTGDKYDIHPTDKTVVGTRLGEIICDKYYENSPYFEVLEKTSDKLVLQAKNAKNLEVKNYQLLVEVDTIAAKTEINQDKLIVEIKNDSKLVRYGWQNAPELSLFNEVGYSVSPFEFKLK